MELYGSLVANEGSGGGGTADVPIKSISVNGQGVVPVNKNVNIDVPTKTSQLTNDSSFITEDDLTAKDYADKTYVGEQINNQFATASGDFITVNDSVDGNIVELGIKGNSFQQTYSGKNLLVYPYTNTTKVDSGVTFTDNGDGSVTINGTNTTDKWVYFWLFGSSASDEIKRENLYGKQLIISGLKNDVGNIKIETYYKTTDNKEYWIRPTGDNDYFTVTYPSKSEIAAMNFAIVIYPNGVVNNVTVKPMIRLATETDSSYEPYVGGIPAPNPSYPQTINSVGDDGSIVVTSCGKNVLKNTNGNINEVGITFTKNSDGSISCTGTQTGHSYYKLNDDLKVDFKGKYILSGNTTTNSNEWGYCLFLQLMLENGTYKYIFNNTPDEVVADFSKYPTLKRVRQFIRIGKDAPALTNKTITFYPMLRPYGTDGTYEPYKESTTTIQLSEPLRAIGDVKDEITYQDGKWGVLRRIGSVAYDGSDDESWYVSASEDKSFNRMAIIISPSFIDADSRSVYKPLCNIAELVDGTELYNKPKGEEPSGFCIANQSRLYIHFNNTDITDTLDKWKTYLQNNNMELVSVLATPTFEPFADQTLPYLSTYDGATNIFNDDALSAEMTVKYPTTDVSGVGSRNESRIADIEGRIVDIEGTIGSTDISSISNGTVTGAISMMNSKLGGLTFSTSGTTLTITDGTHTWTLESNS